MIKLSIIIPVFRIERYLPQCLDSVLALASDKVEIICVNDGSPDGCARILEDYAKRDPRVCIIEQKNRGLSAARNVGVEAARGEYILFVDGDDFVVPDLFAQCFERLDDYPSADVFAVDFCMVFSRDGQYFEKPIFQITQACDGAQGLDFLPKMLSQRRCFWNVWRYIWRRAFLLEHQITFQEGWLCEDVEYTTKVFMARPQIVFFHCPFYRYRIAREDSLMGQTTSKRVHNVVISLENCIRWLDASDFEWKQSLISQYQFELLLTLAQYWELPREERGELSALFRKKLPLFQIGSDGIAHAAYVVCSVMGIPFASLSLSAVKWITRKGRVFWKAATGKR